MPITKAPAFQFYVKDWRSSRSVQRMSFKERGMYLEMLLEQWDEGSLPDDAAAVCQIIGGMLSDWQKAWATLRPNFLPTDGRLVNQRLEQERDKQEKYRRRQSNKASNRWEKERGLEHAAAVPRDSHGSATAVPRHSSGIDTEKSRHEHPPDPGNALHLPLHLHLQSASAVASADSSSGSKRPIFSGQRFTVFEWQLDGIQRLLGPHFEDFDVHAWFFALDERVVQAREIVPQRDGGAWLLAQTQAEAIRRGLVMASAASADEAIFEALVAKGPSVRPV